MRYQTYQQAYLENLYKALSSDGVLYNYIFHIEDITNVSISFTDKQKQAQQYINDYIKWSLGDLETSNFINTHPHTKQWIDNGKKYNTLYSSFIKRGLDEVVQELSTNPNSRRAHIAILGLEHYQTLSYLREGIDYIEFPCTMGLTFYIKDEKVCCSASMRSNNLVTLVNQDVSLFTSIQKRVAALLGRECGLYTHFCVNSHVLPEHMHEAQQVMDSLRKVATCIIERDHKILLAQRSLSGSLPGLWEFPGGKLEQQETAQQAAYRELKEEFGYEAEDLQLVAKLGEMASVYQTGPFLLHLYRFQVKKYPRYHPDHEQILWWDPKTPIEVDLLPSNYRIVKLIKSY